MPDFRVSDARAEDDRLDRAGLAAFGLWSAAGSYAMRELTDGWVPERFVRSRRGGSAAARRLVDEELWLRETRDGTPGYRFCTEDWADQRTAEEIEQSRADTASRMRALRRRQKDRLVRESGQLTTGLMAVDTPPGDDARDPERDASRDPERDSERDPERDTECARLPPPPPPPVGGYGEEEASGSERATAPAPGIDDLPASELERLDPRCSHHRKDPPGTPTPSCRDCAIRRRAISDALARVGAGDLAARRAVREAAAARVQTCPDCDSHAWLLGTDGTPVDPATRCAHPRVVAAELVDTHPSREAR